MAEFPKDRSWHAPMRSAHGAGIVGVSVALHLVKRGLAVVLIDRGDPGQGTSYGNAGIIEFEHVVSVTVSVALVRPAAHRPRAVRRKRIITRRSQPPSPHGFSPIAEIRSPRR